MTERRDVDDVRVVRMDNDVADMAGCREAHIAPCPATISGLIDAVAVRDVAADGSFARAGIDDIRVGVRNGQRADSSGCEEAIRDVLPMRAAIRRLPDAPGAGAEEERPRLGRMPGDGDDAPTPMWPN